MTERGTFLKQLQANIAKAVVSADTLSPDGIQARLEELQKELIKKANNKQDYDAIADEILRLREQKEQSEVDSHHREETMNRIKELQGFIVKQKTDIIEFDEALVKKLIEKIAVFADHFTVEFKSGLVIDIEAYNKAPLLPMMAVREPYFTYFPNLMFKSSFNVSATPFFIMPSPILYVNSSGMISLDNSYSMISTNPARTQFATSFFTSLPVL